MIGSRILRPAFFAALLACACFAHAVSPQKIDTVTLDPAFVIAGSPELIRVSRTDSTHVDGELAGRKLQFFRSRDGSAWLALAGVDVESPTGPAKLKIHLTTPQGASDIERTIDVHPAHYRTGRLTVSPKFVEPGPDEQKQIADETGLKTRVFAAGAPEPLWRGNFRAPVPAQATDSFGTRRMFNGKLASIHKGADFRAAAGTPVHAANSGVVVLARPLYYEGNCVAIDHGMGLYTLSMHFSRIDVHEGQRVKQGQRLGLSGATGRVTGPHLHWAVRWQGAYLDPVKLLKLNLAAAR